MLSSNLTEARGPSTAPLVSVILPVYNDEDTIERSLGSLLEQTYENCEFIVVNDGSTDSTPKVVRGLASAERRIRFVDIVHSGTSSAKNAGYALSSGPIIFFAEGDAIYEKDYVEKAVNCLESSTKFGGVCVLGGIWEIRRTFVTRSIEAENAIKHTLLHEGRMKPYFAWVFKREALDKVGLYDTSLKQAEDRDLFSRVTQAGYQIGLVEGVHWRHRRYETAWQFAKKSFRKGANRIAFVSKGARVADFARAVAGLWILIALFLLSLTVSWMFAIVLTVGVVAILLFLYLRILRLRLIASVPKVSLAILPFYQLLRYFSNGLGYTFGLVMLLIRKARRSDEP
ncbi:MAG TPA: glycosyltransferase [Nitrososphaerales archaeon]|nr:glycosyltransferase [Nitrososphaerales archaeon]